MCKYCDPDDFFDVTELIIDKRELIPVMKYEEQFCLYGRIRLNKNDKPVLYTEFCAYNDGCYRDKETGEFRDDIISQEVEINYCPICGRKLTK